jgi:2-isopropylmalate synthase
MTSGSSAAREGQPVLLYDTTLRDGTQREGLTVSLTDKIKIARRLDEFGMSFIEGGWPGSNPKDSDFFVAARGMTWKNARIAAFGFTRNRSNRVEDDTNIRSLIEAGSPVITLVGKTWRLHVTDVLNATLDENLAMIRDSVAWCQAAGREVIYDLEHYFDGYRDDPAYALACARAARDAGATTLVMCDTNGGTLTSDLVEMIRASRAALEGDSGAPAFTWGIHGHNDSELAVANSLAAIAAGCRQVQGTVNGYGERCGNANLVSILANLELKTQYPVVPSGKLLELSALSHYVAEIVNLAPDDHQPYVGRSAFAHKGGIHGAATAKVEMSYQHVDPRVVGNESRLVVSELGGKANTRLRAEQLGHRLEGVVDAKELSQLVKRLEADGVSFEGAEASFELLIRRLQPGYAAPFQVLGCTVIVEQRDGQELRAEATVKVQVEGEVLHTAADGNGPVNALDAAVRKALRAFYPQLDHVHLVDYKVRIVDGAAATAARTRVVIESAAEGEAWSTVGSDTNIIMASMHALTDSLEYSLWKSGAELRRRDERHFTTPAAG